MLPAWHWMRATYDHRLEFHLYCYLAHLQRQTQAFFVFDLSLDLSDVADRGIVLEPLESDDHDVGSLDDPSPFGG